MKKVRILSIDGGGIRGILPGIILTELEKMFQEKMKDPTLRVADMFDFMAGTSTGGILTLAYLAPGKNGKAKFSAQDAVDLYLNRGDEIFDISVWQKLSSGFGVTDEKYDAKELEEALDDNFGEMKLSELLKPCIVSAYDIRQRDVFFFKQHKASDPAFNFKVKDAARATSAAPTYFEVARVKNDLGIPYPLIDGGVFANNPALAAYSEARKMDFGFIQQPTAKNMMIVSVGTGSKLESYEYKKAKDFGALQWLKPILDIMMSGGAQACHHYLQQIFDTLSASDRKNYFRLEPDILTADSAMDNASIKNMDKLRMDALAFVAKEKKQLTEIVDKLVEFGKD